MLDALHIGDYIILKEARIECFISAEGILSNDVYVDDQTSTIADSLFCIHLQVSGFALYTIKIFIFNLNFKSLFLIN